MKYDITTQIAVLPVVDYVSRYRDTERFIKFCEVCNKYNRCWACPPFDFEPTDIIARYKTIYIVGTKIVPDSNSWRQSETKEERNNEWKKLLSNVRKPLDEKLLQLEQQYVGSRAFYAGTCFNCPLEQCTRSQELPCVQPQTLRYSLEAFGFDMVRTASELLNIELKWEDNNNFPEYITLISGFMTNQEIALDIENSFD